MKYPIGIIALTFSIAIASWLSFSSTEINDSLHSPFSKSVVDDPNGTNRMLNCPVTCNVTDSLALIDLWVSTGGNFFTWTSIIWNPGFDPVCNWDGITVSSAGCVTHINLTNQGLTGPLPSSIGNMTCLEELRLGNNKLSGSLPPSITNLGQLKVLQLNDNDLSGPLPINTGNLTNLEYLHITANKFNNTLPSSIGNLDKLQIMWIDGNEFTGEVPSTFGDLSSLESFFFDENQITGKIPISFLSLSNLLYLEFFQNKIDSVPDLTSLSLNSNRLRMENNRLTFEDILPNWGGALANNYFPQDSVNDAYTDNLTTGTYYELDLGFDSGVTNSTYEWFRNGVSIGTTAVNKLVFPSIMLANAGVYRCKVTNTTATNLTLHTRPVTLNITCGTSINTITDSLCIGESIDVNMTNYNVSKPTDTIHLTTPEGCDSVIHIHLYYPNGDAIENYTDTICMSDTVIINGEEFYKGNEFGFFFFPGESAYGCDSILNVDIKFHPMSATGTYTDMICRGDTLHYMGDIFYEGKETGTVMVTDKDVNGCDSMVNVTISFFDPAEITFDQTLCIDDSITINGTIYHSGNPTGRDTIPNLFAPFCDSIIIVNLSFDNFATGTYRDTLCAGDSVTINGIVYNEINPTGTDTLPNGSVSMCDSITTIIIDFYPPAVGTFSTTICPEDSVFVGGTFYHFNHSKDTLYSTNANGCDSTLYIDIQFFPKVEVNYNADLCPTDSLIINGTVYKVGKTSGTEVFKDSTSNGCDSTVIVNINILPEATESISPTLCFGDSITINGTIYHDGYRTGTERIPGVAPNGCDSVLTVSIDFHPRAEGSLVLEVCEGKCEDYNGTTYCFGDSGTEKLMGAAANGCDSFVVVSVIELPEAETAFSTILCPGDSLLFNGNYYHDDNRTGIERIPGAASNGCDSVYFVSVSFYDTVQTNFNGSLCFGESITINGKVFDQDTTSGTVIFENRAANGCDSIVHVDLDFMAFALAKFEPILCDGDSITINGVIYHENNLTGKDTLPDASSSGCDSIICVNISFYPKAEKTIDTTLCPGENLVVNGVIYNENNLQGRDTVPGIAPGGCDSIFIVQIAYFPESIEELFMSLCPGDSITINDTIYHAGRTTGIHLFGGASIEGCDSTLAVFIDFHPIVETELTPSICPGQTITINSKPYDQDNTTGRDTFLHPITGCDSIVIINVTVSDTLRSTLDEKWCFDQSIEINSNTYDYFTRTGMETVNSSGGCDSIITINLDFYEELIDTIDGTFCENYSIEVNNKTYDITMPTGTENMISSAGCDSTIFVDLKFTNSIKDTIEGKWCYEQSIEVDGEVFDYFNRSGTKNMTTVSGCDSIITIDLDFYEEAILRIEETWCFEESMDFNGETYDYNNRSDTISLTNGNGCDSIIIINLDFYEEAKFVLEDTWCFGESIDINGETYDANNPSDTIILTNGNGCDSTIMIRLDFYPEAKTVMNESICEGEDFELDGEFYSIEDTYLITLMQNSSTGCDSVVELNLDVLTIAELGFADAGFDQLACNEEAPVNANLPNGVSGSWSSLEGGDFLDPTNAATMVQNLEAGYNFLVWTLSSPECPNYDADTVMVELEAIPEADDDEYTLNHLETFADFDIRENDLFYPDIDWFVELQNLPVGMDFELLEEDLVRFSPNEFKGSTSFNYLLCSENCPDRCDSAEVLVFVESDPILIDTTVSIPNGITPNGDGLNDLFIIDALETNPDDFPNNELMIFNRWGDVIYKASPYLNDWGGKNMQGKELPQGTYYYVLRLSIEGGEMFKGDITILK